MDILRNMLPEVCPSGSHFGNLNLSGTDIPVTGVAGDQQAALFGQTCFKKGDIKNTYGTGCFMLMNTEDTICNSKNSLVSTISATVGDKINYALEGSVFTGGAIIQWLRDEMGLITRSRDCEKYARTVVDTGGVYIVPAFTGLGAPYWDMYARGTIIGITRGTNRNHIIRAAEEAIAYQSADLLRSIEQDIGLTVDRLRVDGGGSVDSFLMQFQSDILNIEVIRPTVKETTALGAALLAGLTVGFWNDLEEVSKRWTMKKTYKPHMEPHRRNELLSGWHKAIEHAKGWLV